MSPKEIARQLQADYIPNGPRLSRTEQESLIFRPTSDDEIYQCGMQASFDPQSGPIYCGKIADWVAVLPDGIVAACDRHAPRRQRLKASGT